MKLLVNNQQVLTDIKAIEIDDLEIHTQLTLIMENGDVGTLGGLVGGGIRIILPDRWIDYPWESFRIVP